MRCFLLLLAVMLGIGCDNPALLANIDTYTCAYLPGAIDCTTQEVHDKAVGLLEHGIVSAQIECAGPLVRTTTPFDTVNPQFKAQRLIDGSCLTVSNVSALALIPRSDPTAATCSRTSFTSTMFVEGGVVVLQNSPSPLDRFEGAVETVCTGFNFEAFGVE